MERLAPKFCEFRTVPRQKSPLPLNCEGDPVDGGGGNRLDSAQWNAVEFRDNFCVHLLTGKFGECTYGDRDGALRFARRAESPESQAPSHLAGEPARHSCAVGDALGRRKSHNFRSCLNKRASKTG